jgi:tyrosine-protein kinase Etk/Wzc
MQDLNNDFTVSNAKPHQDVDIKFLVGKIFGNWYWYVISVVLFLALAMIIFLYVSPYYTVQARVLVNGYNSQGRQLTGTDETTILNGLGSATGYPNSVSNELEIMHSRTLVEKTMRDLQLNVQYYGQNVIRYEEIYKESPYFIHLLSLSNIIDPIEYDVRVVDGKVKFEDEDSDSSFTASYGDTLKFWYGSWVLDRNPGVVENNPKRRLGLIINSYNSTLYALMDDIEAITTNEYVNIVDITITRQAPQKYEDMMRYLLNLYVRSDVDHNNMIADSTIAFINDRLIDVSYDLSNIDKNIETFKKQNRLTDLSDDSKQLLQVSATVNQQLSDKQVQLKVIEDLEKYLKDASNSTRVMPTTAPIQDAAFVQTLDKYNTLELQRQSYLQNSTEQNPNVKSIDIQLSQLRGDLLSMMSTYKNGVATQQNDLLARNTEMTGQIKQVPTQERIYIDYTRKQNVMQSLYLYLLQTREQTEVSKSNNVGPIRVIDQPQRGPLPFFPSFMIVFPSAIFLGLLIPSVVIFLRELLNIHVLTTDDITNYTNVPVVADISHSKGNKLIVISADSRNQVAEQIRTLRTNLQFLMPNPEEKTIMFTSSMGGEGKSFIGTNLAASIAISGKKVLLMELDLRKPHIHNLLDVDNSVGFSNYIVSDIKAKDIIKPTTIHPNFYFVPAGTLPPNPAELLVHERVGQLFEEVKSQFDFIIVDSSPVGLVADALLLGKYVDTVLYIVRQRFTHKKQINLIQGLANDRRFKNINIIFNDIKRLPGYGYGYGYSYTHRFGKKYGYYYEDDDRSFFQKIFSKKKKTPTT